MDEEDFIRPMKRLKLSPTETQQTTKSKRSRTMDEEFTHPLKRLKLSSTETKFHKSKRFPLPEFLLVKILEYFPNQKELILSMSYLPKKYIQLISEYNILDRVNKNYEQNTPCLGCLYDSPSQKDHMMPPDGCLYEETMDYDYLRSLRVPL